MQVVTCGTQRLWDETIHMALKKCAADVTRRGGGQWSFTLNNGKPLKTSARIDEDWLVMDAAVCSGKGSKLSSDADRLWDLLHWNIDLRGGAKFVLHTDHRPRLRAEMPLEEGVEVHCRIREACTGFRAASRRLRHSKRGKYANSSASITVGDNAIGDDLQQLCTEAGWPFARRRAGRLAVELDVSHGLDGFYQATVTSAATSPRTRCLKLGTSSEQGRGRIQASVELAAWESESLTRPSRRALAVLLLTASAIIRMARATAEESDGRTVVRFEVVFPDAPIAGELAHALSALSVACRLCGKEVKVLQAEEISREYLAVRGWSS